MGDINSSFFHRVINKRQRSNGIFGLEAEGEWIEDPKRIKEKIKEYFQNLFLKREATDITMPSSLVEAQLLPEDGDALTRALTEEEIKEAVWDCDGSKSPGPDGFNIGFYKACWNIIKGDLLRVLMEFHSNGKLARGCNSSFIALIPKKEGTCGLKVFRPISLIGSLYKIIAKVLAN